MCFINKTKIDFLYIQHIILEFDGIITSLYNRAVDMKQWFFCTFICPSATGKGATKVRKSTEDVHILFTLHLWGTAKNLITWDLATILVLLITPCHLLSGQRGSHHPPQGLCPKNSLVRLSSICFTLLGLEKEMTFKRGCETVQWYLVWFNAMSHAIPIFLSPLGLQLVQSGQDTHRHNWGACAKS